MKIKKSTYDTTSYKEIVKVVFDTLDKQIKSKNTDKPGQMGCLAEKILKLWDSLPNTTV